jgi:hypothetical protein
MTYFNGQLLRSDEGIKIDASLSIFECKNHSSNGIEGKLLVDNNYYEFLFLITEANAHHLFDVSINILGYFSFFLAYLKKIIR